MNVYYAFYDKIQSYLLISVTVGTIKIKLFSIFYTVLIYMVFMY